MTTRPRGPYLLRLSVRERHDACREVEGADSRRGASRDDYLLALRAWRDGGGEKTGDEEKDFDRKWSGAIRAHRL